MKLAMHSRRTIHLLSFFTVAIITSILLISAALSQAKADTCDPVAGPCDPAPTCDPATQDCGGTDTTPTDPTCDPATQDCGGTDTTCDPAVEDCGGTDVCVDESGNPIDCPVPQDCDPATQDCGTDATCDPAVEDCGGTEPTCDPAVEDCGNDRPKCFNFLGIEVDCPEITCNPAVEDCTPQCIDLLGREIDCEDIGCDPTTGCDDSQTECSGRACDTRAVYVPPQNRTETTSTSLLKPSASEVPPKVFSPKPPRLAQTGVNDYTLNLLLASMIMGYVVQRLTKKDLKIKK